MKFCSGISYPALSPKMSITTLGIDFSYYNIRFLHPKQRRTINGAATGNRGWALNRKMN